MAGARTITLRRADSCASCGSGVPAGVEASWDAATRTVTCRACTDGPCPPVVGVAGASARATGARQKADEERRRQALKERRPIMGRLALAVAGPSKAGTSYTKGAVGEEKLGAKLDDLTAKGALVLHDRRRPGTKANIDHLVVAPSGVWVVDAKRYSGVVTRVDKGGWLTIDNRLMIGGRDRTKLIEGVEKQMADVRRILADAGHGAAPVHGALCFVDTEFGPLRPFRIDGVLVTWGRALRSDIMQRGPLDAGEGAAIHRLLAASLPAAV